MKGCGIYFLGNGKKWTNKLRKWLQAIIIGRTFIDKENLKEKGGGFGVLEIQKGNLWRSNVSHEEDRSILSEL